MNPHILGIHHVTAIAGDPQQNLEFYTRVLGLRLVKLTVNFDDPGTYHLYFGDEIGRPGTIYDFFPVARRSAPAGEAPDRRMRSRFLSRSRPWDSGWNAWGA